MLSIHFFCSSTSLFFIFKKDSSKSIFAPISTNTKNNTLFDVSEVSEKVSNLFKTNLIWKATNFYSYWITILDYKELILKNKILTSVCLIRIIVYWRSLIRPTTKASSTSWESSSTSWESSTTSETSSTNAFSISRTISSKMSDSLTIITSNFHFLFFDYLFIPQDYY